MKEYDIFSSSHNLQNENWWIIDNLLYTQNRGIKIIMITCTSAGGQCSGGLLDTLGSSWICSTVLLDKGI
jgi:hypothetical protein